MQKQPVFNKPPPSPEEKEISGQIDEIIIKKLYDTKSLINHDYSSILKHEDPSYYNAYSQLETVCSNQMKKLNEWKQNYIDSANMTYNCSTEIINHQKEAANDEADQRILDYIAFKARLLMNQFPKQAKFFQKLEWKSPIIQPETFQYPFRPDVKGDTTDYKSIMFPDYQSDDENQKMNMYERKPNVHSILGEIGIGDNAILNLPEGIALSVKVDSINGDSIKFITDDDEEINVPAIQFEDKRFFLQKH